MARFTPTAAVTVVDHWSAGDFVRFDYVRDELFQNLEYLMQSHDHNGNLGDGATLAVADPKAIWVYGNVGGGPVP